MYMKINLLILWQCKWFDCGMDYISINWNVLILILKYLYISFHFYRLEVFPIYLVLQIFSGIYAPVSKKYITQAAWEEKKKNKPKTQIQNTSITLLTRKGWQYISSLSRWIVIISYSWLKLLCSLFIKLCSNLQRFSAVCGLIFVLGRLVYAAGYQSGGRSSVSLNIPCLLIDL